MPLRNELQGLRGSRLVTRIKQRMASLVGRAFRFDQLPAALEYTFEKHLARGLPLAYWEFGTGSGNTLQRAIPMLKRYPTAHVVLFDSFKGLPPPKGEHDAHVTWESGDFAFPRSYIEGVLQKNRLPLSRVRFVEGFFEESLTQELAASLQETPPSFVTLDLDYYSSTKAALDFLAPLMSSGCGVFFDDLWSFDGHPEYGQLRALNEFNSSNRRGQLVPNTIFNDRIYSYFNSEYEFARR